ncbi:MAG: DNA mismatch repair protein MutS, partial [Bacteroidetes bacterium RIFOXYA12_FULL_33_9]
MFLNQNTLSDSSKIVKTPLMQQYFRIKEKHPEAILLFRVGDFYETFDEDAVKTSEILGITLTKRANGSASFVDLAGFPYHSLDTYLPKLVRAGQRVAICEQLEDPKLTKNIVKRGVTELVTPGVSFNDNVLNHRENNFLACVYFGKIAYGVAFVDVSTGEFLISEGSAEYIDKLLQSFQPKEVLFEKGKTDLFKEHFGTRFYTFQLDEWTFNEDSSNERLLKHFETKSLKGFGVQNMQSGIIAAGATLHYLDLTQHENLKHIISLSRIDENKFVWLDKFTIRNLELFNTINEGGKSLINIIDKTISPMGSRMLKRWVALPLKDIKPIEERQTVVQYFIDNYDIKRTFEQNLNQIGDLERIISKVAVGRVNPREINQLKNALSAITNIKDLCEKANDSTLHRIGEQLNPCKSILEKIEREISPDPPVQVAKGNVIASGVSAELDELRSLLSDGKDYMIKIQQRESERTSIPSLKVSFNNVFGYYIEVRNTHKDKVPDDWIRKQTLVSAERYITSELKDYEEKILGAEEKILTIETKLYNEIIIELANYIAPIQLDANLIAQLDCLLSFATVALSNNYACPKINDTKIIDIKEGRHPVIEKQLSIGEEYVSNNVYLDNDKQQIIIITGPNMSGKS